MKAGATQYSDIKLKVVVGKLRWFANITTKFLVLSLVVLSNVLFFLFANYIHHSLLATTLLVSGILPDPDELASLENGQPDIRSLKHFLYFLLDVVNYKI